MLKTDDYATCRDSNNGRADFFFLADAVDAVGSGSEHMSMLVVAVEVVVDTVVTLVVAVEVVVDAV